MTGRSLMFSLDSSMQVDKVHLDLAPKEPLTKLCLGAHFNAPHIIHCGFEHYSFGFGTNSGRLMDDVLLPWKHIGRRGESTEPENSSQSDLSAV
jgi:hypothetical protein